MHRDWFFFWYVLKVYNDVNDQALALVLFSMVCNTLLLSALLLKLDPFHRCVHLSRVLTVYISSLQMTCSYFLGYKQCTASAGKVETKLDCKTSFIRSGIT